MYTVQSNRNSRTKTQTKMKTFTHRTRTGKKTKERKNERTKRRRATTVMEAIVVVGTIWSTCAVIRRSLRHSFSFSFALWTNRTPIDPLSARMRHQNTATTAFAVWYGLWNWCCCCCCNCYCVLFNCDDGTAQCVRGAFRNYGFKHRNCNIIR